MAALRTYWSRDWPNEMVADLRKPPQTSQAGSFSPASSRRRTAAIGMRREQLRQSTYQRCRAVRGRAPGGAGLLVQTVDVLGDQSGEAALALQLDSARWPALGSASQAAADRRNFHASARTSDDARYSSMSKIAWARDSCPQALRAAEVGDPGGGGDPGAGQYRVPAGLRDEIGHP